MPGNKLIVAILHYKVEISLMLALVENLHPSWFQAFHSINKHITKESDLIPSQVFPVEIGGFSARFEFISS